MWRRNEWKGESRDLFSSLWLYRYRFDRYPCSGDGQCGQEHGEALSYQKSGTGQGRTLCKITGLTEFTESTFLRQPVIPMSSGLSDRASHLNPFHVMDILARARQMEQAGIDVCHLEIGEPDFPTPVSITEAGIRAATTYAAFTSF